MKERINKCLAATRRFYDALTIKDLLAVLTALALYHCLKMRAIEQNIFEVAREVGSLDSTISYK